MGTMMRDPDEDLVSDVLNYTVALKSSMDLIHVVRTRMSSYPIPRDLESAIKVGNNVSNLTNVTKDYMKIIANIKTCKSIQSHHHWFVMKLLLYLEYYECNMRMNNYTLRNRNIKRSNYTPNAFVICVSGLKEDGRSPKVGDYVLIMQVESGNYDQAKISFVGNKYITVNANRCFGNQFSELEKYDIVFLLSDYCSNCAHFAVDKVHEFELLPMLFPTGTPINKIQKHQDLLCLNDTINSNPEQQQAIIHILAKTAFPAPYILFGPPGTGKTSTLVEAIAQILKKNPSDRILVCAPSNAAADEVAVRLLKRAVDARGMHRMYSLSKDCKDVKKDLKNCSNFGDNTAIMISREILKMKSIVITTLLTSFRLISYELDEDHFSYIFVDEAGQATEPETLIPMTLMSSSRPNYKGMLHGQLVIAGDPHQLGPLVQSPIAQPLLGRSMLERLLDWHPYRKDAKNKFNPTYVTRLVRNFRSHSAILHIPNTLFYDGELIPCGGERTNRAVDWKTLPNANFPLIFHAVDGKEGRDQRSPSVYNSSEIMVIISYIKNLLSSTLGGRDVRQDEIGIVTPYKLQAQKIHDQLKANNWDGVVVGTVETFQGQEKDIIIISTVRSTLCSNNGQIHVGHLSNQKRFNVALTRAKCLLIVVGNPVILQVDEYWRAFINYCDVNGACRGSKFIIGQHMSHAKMSQLVGQKHVVVQVKNQDTLDNVIETPEITKTLRLPEINPNRRRRLPRAYVDDFNEKTKGSDSSENNTFFSSIMARLHI